MRRLTFVLGCGAWLSLLAVIWDNEHWWQWLATSGVMLLGAGLAATSGMVEYEYEDAEPLYTSEEGHYEREDGSNG